MVPSLVFASALAILGIAASSYASPWNPARLALARLLLEGYPLYQPAHAGPVLQANYGPLFPLAFVPAALLPSPPLAMKAGILTALLSYFLPALAALGLATRKTGRIHPRRALLLGSAFVLLTAKSGALGFSAACIHPDSVGLGLAALAVTVTALPETRHSSGRQLAAALLATLAFWTKQTLAPVLIAQLVVAARLWGLPGTRAFAIRLFGVLALGSAIALAIPNLWFSSFELLARHPLKPDHSLWTFLRTVTSVEPVGALVSLLALGLTLPSLLKALPDLDPRESPPKRIALAHGTCALFLIPASYLGFMKVGGAENNLSLVFYFSCISALALAEGFSPTAPAGSPTHPSTSWVAVALLAITALAREESSLLPLSILGFFTLAALAANLFAAKATGSVLPGGGGRPGTIAHVFLLTVFAALPVDRAAWSERRIARLSDPIHDPAGSAYALALANPGRIYFPYDPLATLYVDRKLYHHDFAIADREHGGYPVDREHFLRHLPPDIRIIAYAPGTFAARSSRTRRFFADRMKPLGAPEAKGWTLFSLVEMGDAR